MVGDAGICTLSLPAAACFCSTCGLKMPPDTPLIRLAAMTNCVIGWWAPCTFCCLNLYLRNSYINCRTSWRP